MKPALVSLILPLVFLPPPNQGLPTIVVMGRVTNAATSGGLEAANVRMPELAASVGTDSNGRYRITVLDKFRGLEVTVNVRAIGFAPQSRTIRLVTDTITMDFALAVDVNRLSEVVITGVTDATELKKLGFSVSHVFGSTAANAAIGAGAAPPQGLPGRYRPVDNTESYDRIVDNPFLGARADPLSTFSVDVDRASYSNVRRFVTSGQRPPKDAVRIEELVNYFAYEYPEPDKRH